MTSPDVLDLPDRAGAPPAEVDVDVALARALVEDQHPHLADLPVCALTSGWDNVLLRLGDSLLLRFPRRAVAAPLVVHEQRWLPVLAPTLPVAVPTPTHLGRPGRGYPWAWSIVPWLPGEPATTASIAPEELADDLAGFCRALHRPAPAELPTNPFRGVPLAARDHATLARLPALAGEGLDVDGLRARWRSALAAPPHRGPPVILHGDLHPANLLIADGRLTAVLDFGDLCGGDPATDLAIGWWLFDDDAHARMLDAAGASSDVRRRAEGWALSIALAVAATDRVTALGAAARRTLSRVLDASPDAG